MLRHAGQSEEQVRAAMETYARSSTPIGQALTGLIGAAVTGLVASLLIGAFVRAR